MTAQRLAVIIIAVLAAMRSDAQVTPGSPAQPGAPPPAGFVVDVRPVAAFQPLLLEPAEVTLDWLDAFNDYRAAALLPPVVEDSTFQVGCQGHSIYCVKNNVLVHAEDPSLPYYTPEGDAAGRSSNVMASSSSSTTDRAAIDLWMAGPFHAVGMIDPVLERTGFGSYREVKVGYQMAATLDVLRGRNAAKAVTFPVMWPAAGQSMPARCSGGTTACYSGGESPNPLASCAGYATPSGLPIVLQLGKGSVTPAVTATSFRRGNALLEHCVFDETTYTNSDSNEQSLGRAVLGGRDAIVMIPRLPLDAGQSYTASITTNGATYTWTFRVGAPVSAQPGDYDGDRRSDVAVFRESVGTWFVVHSSTGSGWGRQWGAMGDLPARGDYDGDRQIDPAVFRPSTGTWYVLQSSTGSGVGLHWGVAGDQPVPADYDGDGKTDVAVYRPAGSVWFIIRSSTSTAIAVQWGQANDIPVPADFDGDGKADPTVFRPSTGTWYQLRSAAGGGYAVRWGQNGDRPLGADYDGDGRADPTVFRPSTGTWYELRSGDGRGFALQWGVSTDVAVVGDYDADGKADPTVFRSSTGTWYQLRSRTGAGVGVVWGVSGDRPQ